MQALGFNYRITDFQCALGLSQLERLDELGRAAQRDRRRATASCWPTTSGSRCRPWRPRARCTATTSSSSTSRGGAAARLQVFEGLRAAGIGVQVHYIPIYRLPYYRDDARHRRRTTARTPRHYYAGAISLPMFPG